MITCQMRCPNCGQLCIAGNDGHSGQHICNWCNCSYGDFIPAVTEISYGDPHLTASVDGYTTPYEYPEYSQIENELQQLQEHGIYDVNGNYEDPRERWENMTEYQRIHLFNTMMDNFHQQAIVDTAEQEGYITQQVARNRRHELMIQSGELAQAHLNQES